MFNFLNKTRMKIVSNKWDGIGMEAIRPEPVSLPSLLESTFFSTKGMFEKVLKNDLLKSTWNK